MIRLRGVSVAISILVALVLAACGGGEAAGPPDIEYGRDVCAECHMIISEARFASAYRDPDGEAFVFDDIGDMVAHATRFGFGEGDMTAWVHDYHTEEWIDAPDAAFVRSDGLTTPMGSGVVAFVSTSDADEFIEDRGGQLLTWADVLGGAAASSGAGHDHQADTDHQTDNTDHSETTEREDQP